MSVSSDFPLPDTIRGLLFTFGPRGHFQLSFFEIYTQRLVLAGIVYICLTACGTQCKVFVDKVLFQMRHIGIEEGVILLQMINLNILK